MPPKMQLLVLNAGSSSLKFALYSENLVELVRGRIANIGPHAQWLSAEGGARSEEFVAAETPAEAVRHLLDRLAARLTRDLVVVHRIVHGGSAYSAPAAFDATLLAKLAELEALAPLHLPVARQVIAVTRELVGASVPSIAVFDTALFQELPAVARTYAVPAPWRVQYGVRRYGFHGFAHQCLREAALRAASGAAEPARIITVQLGRGCSIAAFRGRSPIATSMGFSPLEGLIMPTRAGSIDAAAALHLVMQGGLEPQDVLRDLNEKCGLLGLSGLSAEPAELVRSAQRGHADSALALDAFFFQLHQYLGAYAGLLGGIDVLAMGGGLCEYVPQVRQRLFEGVAWLGCEVDAAANAGRLHGITVLSRSTSKVRVLGVVVDEERVMAEQAMAFLQARGSPTRA